jgi:hypothetical protein
MGRPIRAGDCVRLADGRTGRARTVLGDSIRVRVRRQTSATHRFVTVRAAAISRVDCPKGWMSPQGYTRYLRVTLAKMRTRLARKTRARN